jgi:PAS domain S-box-containing protein
MPSPRTARTRTVAALPPSAAAARSARTAVPTPDDRFFREMVSSMRNGVLAVTRDGAIVVMNDEAYRIFGLAPGPGDIGRQYTEVLRTHHDLVRVIASAFELTHLPNRAEMRLKSTGKVIGYTLSLVRDATAEVSGAALFFKDLTRVEQLEERERLRDRLAALGEMAAGMAHELKNPLAGIEVMAGLLRRKVPDSPDAQGILTDIINEAKMANATVVEVLDYVRPVRLETERTSIEEVLNAAVTMADGKARRGDIELTRAIDRDLPLLHADQHQLCQVFTNLIINAFEAMEGQGRIRVSATTGQVEEDHGPQGPTHVPTIVVQITDNGPGVPAEVVDKIFNPFFTTKAQGSGLGLAIVRKIIDAHDGRIDIAPVAGGGTRFTVTLPLSGHRGQWFE